MALAMVMASRGRMNFPSPSKQQTAISPSSASLQIHILGNYYATTANSRQPSLPAQPLYRYIYWEIIMQLRLIVDSHLSQLSLSTDILGHYYDILLLIVDSHLSQISLSTDILGHYYATTANSRQPSHPTQPLYRYIGTLLCFYC